MSGCPVALLRKLEAEGQSLPLKGNREAWANRIRYAIQDAEEARLKAAHLAPEVMLEEDNTRKEAAERCWVHFKAGATALQLSTPLRSSRAVNALALSLLLCFLLSGGGDVLANQSFIQLLHLDPQVYKADIKWAEFLFTKLPLNKDVFRTGEYYRLFTYIFLHGSIGHFLLNLTGLLWFGRIAANIYGEGRLLLIYFASGVFAGLVHAYLSDVPAIGASGAILGVFAAVAVGIFKLKKELPQALRIRELRIMGGLAAGQVIMDRIVPRVAGIIHIAGMFAGLVTAALVFPRQEENWLDRLIARHNAKTIELLDH
jgi:membrane associated rhomboid family serine protease